MVMAFLVWWLGGGLEPHRHVFDSGRGGKVFGEDLWLLRCKCGERAFVRRVSRCADSQASRL